MVDWAKSRVFYLFFYLTASFYVIFFSVSINASNSRMFVSGSCDATARLWDTRVASRAVRTFHGHEGDVNSVNFFLRETDLALDQMMELADYMTSELDTNYKFIPRHSSSSKVVLVLMHLW